MPHKFRTIEQFVQLLEQLRDAADASALSITSDRELKTAYAHAAHAYDHIAGIVRTSNLGIVYPPATVSASTDADVAAKAYADARTEPWPDFHLDDVRREAFRAGWDARDQIKMEKS